MPNLVRVSTHIIDLDRIYAVHGEKHGQSEAVGKVLIFMDCSSPHQRSPDVILENPDDIGTTDKFFSNLKSRMPDMKLLGDWLVRESVICRIAVEAHRIAVYFKIGDWGLSTLDVGASASDAILNDPRIENYGRPYTPSPLPDLGPENRRRF